MEEQGEAREKAAEMVGASPRYVSDAKRLGEESPELLDLVRQDVISLPSALKAWQQHRDLAEQLIAGEVEASFVLKEMRHREEEAKGQLPSWLIDYRHRALGIGDERWLMYAVGQHHTNLVAFDQTAEYIATLLRTTCDKLTFHLNDAAILVPAIRLWRENRPTLEYLRKALGDGLVIEKVDSGELKSMVDTQLMTRTLISVGEEAQADDDAAFDEVLQTAPMPGLPPLSEYLEAWDTVRGSAQTAICQTVDEDGELLYVSLYEDAERVAGMLGAPVFNASMRGGLRIPCIVLDPPTYRELGTQAHLVLASETKPKLIEGLLNYVIKTGARTATAAEPVDETGRPAWVDQPAPEQPLASRVPHDAEAQPRVAVNALMGVDLLTATEDISRGGSMVARTLERVEMLLLSIDTYLLALQTAGDAEEQALALYLLNRDAWHYDQFGRMVKEMLDSGPARIVAHLVETVPNPDPRREALLEQEIGGFLWTEHHTTSAAQPPVSLLDDNADEAAR